MATWRSSRRRGGGSRKPGMKTRSTTSGLLHVEIEREREEKRGRAEGCGRWAWYRAGIRLSTTEISFLAIYYEERKRKGPWVDFKWSWISRGWIKKEPEKSEMNFSGKTYKPSMFLLAGYSFLLRPHLFRLDCFTIFCFLAVYALKIFRDTYYRRINQNLWIWKSWICRNAIVEIIIKIYSNSRILRWRTKILILSLDK